MTVITVPQRLKIFAITSQELAAPEFRNSLVVAEAVLHGEQADQIWHNLVYLFRPKLYGGAIVRIEYHDELHVYYVMVNHRTLPPLAEGVPVPVEPLLLAGMNSYSKAILRRADEVLDSLHRAYAANYITKVHPRAVAVPCFDALNRDLATRRLNAATGGAYAGRN